MKALVVGGAGYIGSHMVQLLKESGCHVVVYDNFSTGNKWANKDCDVIKGDLLDQSQLGDCFRKNRFDTVFHFAAKSIVSESQKNPDFYYRNNVLGTINLLHEMDRHGVKNIIFSSTAAIYGNPKTKKISENHPSNPINVYGSTKFAVESLIKDYCINKEMNGISFRYFNAAGAHSSGMIGEQRPIETHLIPNVLMSSFTNNCNFKVYGNDYKTHDGTCIRDYIHVEDIAKSHLLGAKIIDNINGFETFNIGTEIGFSVLDIIRSCETVLKRKIHFTYEERRSGDPDILIANCKKAKEKLKWKPVYTDINEIIKSAYNFHYNYVNNIELFKV
jgi:UDP-glucose 4-epimerase